MEIGQCTMLLIGLGGFFMGGIAILFGVSAINHWWNKPIPPSKPPQGPFSKAMRYMKDEANKLGITMYRTACVASCLLVLSFVGWGSVSAYNNVTITDCGKGDVAIKFPDPAKRVIVAAGLPCPCGCGCEE